MQAATCKGGPADRAIVADPHRGCPVAAVTRALDGIGAGITVALTRRGFDAVVAGRAIDPAAAIRLAPHGIAVHEVRPGLIRTPMTGAAQARFDALLAEWLTPINHWGTPEGVGRAVATLTAGDLPFTTGAAIQIDGGMRIHHY